MKLVFTALALATIATPAFATSIKLSEACGTVRQKTIMCFAAPCPQPLVLEGSAIQNLELATGNDTRLRAQLRALRDREVCVSGYKEIRKNLFQVVEIK